MDKNQELTLYRVISKYIEALRNKQNGGDDRVYTVSDGKEHRPFVGIRRGRNALFCVYEVVSLNHRYI